MTVRQTRILFGVFFLFTIAVAINTLFLQSGPNTSPAARAAAARAERATLAERQARLALDNTTDQESAGSDAASAQSDVKKPIAAPAYAKPALINAPQSAPPPHAAADTVSGREQVKTAPAPRVVASAPAVQAEGAKRFARLRPDALHFGPGVDTMPFAPDAEGDPATINAVQRELNARGYGPLVADGLPGLITRAAVMAFEFDNHLPLTGEATETFLSHVLLGVAKDKQTAPDARRVRGPHAEALVRTVQQSLVALGYAIPHIDGRMGDDTSKAIASFESVDGMTPRGRISAELFGRLAHAVSAARVRPIH